jgi:anti-sigma B factor antagonist
MDEKQPVEITTNEDVTVVVFNATCISGVEEIQAASERVTKFIAENCPQKMVVDFQQVRFFTSQTLGLLMDIWRRLKDYDGRVVISGINPQLHRVFKITNLDKIFEFFPDRQSALKDITTT